jgi:hypothetical protein
MLACAGEHPAGGLAGAAARGGTPDPSWRLHPVWDDGNAEFNAYEIAWRRYGALYPGRALLLLVKEPWAPDQQVKADRPRADGFDVLKLNHVRDVPTGIYTYHQMGSVYFRRDTAALVKLATTSSEACGISTALMVRGRLEMRSYFDGDAERRLAFPPDAVPADGLPALLRDYVRGEPPARLQVFPSLLAGRFAGAGPEMLALRKRGAAPLQVPAGTFAAVEIELAGAGASWSFFFESELPCRLLLFRDADGTEYRLVKSERLAYWRLHARGDESWLPAALRDLPGVSGDGGS